MRSSVAVLLILAFGLAACGSGDDLGESQPTTTTMATTLAPTTTTTATLDPTTTTTTTVPATTTTLAQVDEYSLVRATDYIGTSARLYGERSFQEIGGEQLFYPWGPWPGAEGWSLRLFRSGACDGPTDADLLVLIAQDTVVDAWLVTRDGADPQYWIGSSCEDAKPALLVDRNDNPVRAWKVSAGRVALTEVSIAELTPAEIDSGARSSTVISATTGGCHHHYHQQQQPYRSLGRKTPHP
jgi:hypothetical protein